MTRPDAAIAFIEADLPLWKRHREAILAYIAELEGDRERLNVLQKHWVRLNENPAVYGFDCNPGSNTSDLREAVDLFDAAHNPGAAPK